MAGWSSPYPHDRDRIAAICGQLDGVALAIELAAARLATLGLDGLEAGLADQMRLLTGGPRLDIRHQSVRSALDWSFGLLDDEDQVVLRRASVFAAPFTSGSAGTVAGHSPLSPEDVPGSLARLADQSLLVVMPDPIVTRYRMLETISQYGAERMDQVGELADVRGRHLRWCLTTAARLEAGEHSKAAFTEVADDLRAGLAWAASKPDVRAEAHDLAVRLARLTYAMGMPSEAQRRYEEAAALAADAADAAEALHLGAVVAWGRHAGNEAIRLYRAASDAARRGGDPRRAARELVSAADVIVHAPGILSEPTPPGEEHALLAEARALAGGDAYLEAAVLKVTAYLGGDDVDPATPRARRTRRRAGRAGRRRLPDQRRTRPANGYAGRARRTGRRRRHRPTPPGAARPPGPRRRDGVADPGRPSYGADGLPRRRRPRDRPPLRPTAQRTALLPRGGPPRRRMAAHRGRPGRRFRRGG